MSRSCLTAGCSLCCKVLTSEFNNAGTWCPNCRPGKGGCMIFATRPKCTGFECGWLQGELGDHWQPNKCHMVVRAGDSSEDLHVNVDPAYPDAWLKEPYHSELRAQVKLGGKVTVHVGNKYVVIADSFDGLPKGADKNKLKIVLPEALGKD